MPEELELSAEETPEDDTIQKQEMTEEELARIFDERFELFMGQLSERVEQEGVRVAVAVLVDPKYPASPLVFKTGHVYDQAKLLANVLRILKRQIDEELSIG